MPHGRSPSAADAAVGPNQEATPPGWRPTDSSHLALWGVLDTGNYDFITEYGFRDDGTLAMRVGATGYNNTNQPTDAHMHDVLWRIDMDLNGSLGDTALLAQHLEPTSALPEAGDLHLPFNNGIEGFAEWDPLEFTSLLIEDLSFNALGEHPGYALEPLRGGTARHYGGPQPGSPSEAWTQHDFWVTRWHQSEDPDWAVPWKPPGDYLFPFVADAESVVNKDLVLWYLASAHHRPIDEDRDGAGNYAVTLTHWFGLELHPHNFFDANPLGGPPICD